MVIGDHAIVCEPQNPEDYELSCFPTKNRTSAPLRTLSLPNRDNQTTQEGGWGKKKRKKNIV